MFAVGNGSHFYILRDDFSSLPLNCYCCSRRCRRQYLPWLQDLEIMVKVPSGGFKARKNDVLSPEASYGLLYHSIKAARRTLNRDQAKEGKRRDTRCAHWP